MAEPARTHGPELTAPTLGRPQLEILSTDPVVPALVTEKAVTDEAASAAAR